MTASQETLQKPLHDWVESVGNGNILRVTQPSSGANRVSIEAIDATERTLSLQGECINIMASNAGNGVYGVLNMMHVVSWRLGMRWRKP